MYHIRMSQELILKSPAKINLTLDILDRDEESGYHRIQTIFQRVNLMDEMVFSVYDGDKLELMSNKRLPEDNTICKAYDIFCKYIGKDLGVRVKLRKTIPAGAGLGGASGNAATTLIGLNHIFSFGFNVHILQELGAKIGMDVPFFVSNYSTALGTHFGNKILSLPPFPSVSVLIFFPKVKVLTEKAYRTLSLDLVGKRVHQTDMLADKLRRRSQDVVSFLHLMHNDFELSIFDQYPKLSDIRNELEKYALDKIMLSGSGSSIVCFGSEQKLRSIQEVFGNKYNVFICKTY